MSNVAFVLRILIQTDNALSEGHVKVAEEYDFHKCYWTTYQMSLLDQLNFFFLGILSCGVAKKYKIHLDQCLSMEVSFNVRV